MNQIFVKQVRQPFVQVLKKYHARTFHVIKQLQVEKNKWQKGIACLKQKDQKTLNVKAFLKKLYELAKIYQLMT